MIQRMNPIAQDLDYMKGQLTSFINYTNDVEDSKILLDANTQRSSHELLKNLQRQRRLMKNSLPIPSF